MENNYFLLVVNKRVGRAVVVRVESFIIIISWIVYRNLERGVRDRKLICVNPVRQERPALPSPSVCFLSSTYTQVPKRSSFTFAPFLSSNSVTGFKLTKVSGTE